MGQIPRSTERISSYNNSAAISDSIAQNKLFSVTYDMLMLDSVQHNTAIKLLACVCLCLCSLPCRTDTHGRQPEQRTTNSADKLLNCLGHISALLKANIRTRNSGIRFAGRWLNFARVRSGVSFRQEEQLYFSTNAQRCPPVGWARFLWFTASRVGPGRKFSKFIFWSAGKFMRL